MRDTVLSVPAFARLTDYVGAWAIEPTAAGALIAVAKETDLVRHVAEAERSEPRAEVQMMTAGLNQKIAVVHLQGTLMKAASSMGGATSTVAARREIRKAASDPEVSAIMIAIDSPGGTVSGTSDLGSDIAAANKKKPVWAYAQDLCASAAYWCASQAERIYANDKTALVGSIGTLLVVYDQSAAAEANGIKTLVFGTGPIKGAGTPGAPVSDEQKAYFRGIVDDSQVHFDSAVKRGRGMTDAKLEKAKTGGVFSADDAISMGLIDGIKSFEAVMTELATEARRRNRAESTRATAITSGVSAMNETTETVARTDADAKAAADLTAENITASNDAVAANLERQAKIIAVTTGHPEIAARAIRENWTADKAELESMKAGLPKVNAVNPNTIQPAIVRSHEKDCTRDALQAAMILRAGGRLDSRHFASGRGKLPDWLRADINDPYRNQVMEAGHRFGEMSAFDMCREALRIDGREIPLGRAETIQAAVSGGTLTNIFTTSVNAMLLMAYMEIGDTTAAWTRESDVADFKTNERIRMKAISGLSKLPRGGEADHLNRTDTAESYKIARYAGQFVIDDQDIIDDSMNALSDMPSEMGKLAARLRPDLVYAILLANPTMADTVALFSAAGTRGNLGTSTAFSGANLKASITAMRLMQENGVNIGLTATHLLVPATLDYTARELINSTAIASGNTSGQGTFNSLQNVVTPISEERLENGVTDPASGTAYSGSASTWFLVSTQANTIEVGYLRGTGRAPTVRPFTLDKGKYGIGWDVAMDIGAKAMDFRGLRKMTA